MTTMKEQFYRHLGVYGICFKDERLLVIEKKLGAYKGRYDLPGGTLEKLESITEGLYREIVEETGYRITAYDQLGVTDIFTTYLYEPHMTEVLHHIGILYEVDINRHESPVSLAEFNNQDSNGAFWLPLLTFNEHNASPLLLEAIHWINHGKLSNKTEHYNYL